MATAPRAGASPPRRRGARIALVAAVAVAALALLLSLVLHVLLEPQRASRFLLDRVGASLGLEIRAAGRAEYRLRGTPVLVLRDVSVRQPGSADEMLHAARIMLSVPWSTIRAGGDVLAARRLEIDAPRLDLPAMQRWLASRPPSPQPRLPTFAEGVRVRDGVLAGAGWSVDGVGFDLPRLAAGEPVHARLRARYLDPPLSVPFDLAIALVDADALLRGARTGFAASGRANVRQGDAWSLPGWVIVSGPLRLGDGGLRMAPARIGISAQWESGTTRLPFALGAFGGLRFDGATWLLADARLSLRGRGAPATDPVPPLHARGQIAFGRRLVLRLRGDIDRWPQSWPALPAPLAKPAASLPFALDYTGAADLGDVAALVLQRDGASLDARFRLAQVQAWLENDGGNPLPPLDARLSVPLLELDGVRLEGVEATLESPEAADAAH